MAFSQQSLINKIDLQFTSMSWHYVIYSFIDEAAPITIRLNICIFVYLYRLQIIVSFLPRVLRFCNFLFLLSLEA